MITPKPRVATAADAGAVKEEVVSMSEGAVPQPAAKLPFEAALMEVVKSLHKDPVLLYGLGAGIILVGVLTVTASLALALVVAAVFVAVLLGRIAMSVQEKRRGSVDTGGKLIGGDHHRAKIGNVDADTAPAGRVRTRFFGLFTSTKGLNAGNVRIGDDRDREDG
jgi:hypothetical protein